MPRPRINPEALPPEVSVERVVLFCRLHQLEIWLRELVYIETKAKFGNEWWQECQAALKRSRNPGIPALKSLTRDARHAHMATPENDPLWFVSFESLLKILFDKKLWPLFAPFLTTKQLVRAKFEELLPIRNRIAHCRSLHAGDLKRVEGILSDFDRGFWRFCASYNDTWRLRHGVTEAVVDRVRQIESQSSRIRIDIDFAHRPSAKSLRGRIAGKRGVLYGVKFIANHPERLKTEEVLKFTQSVHSSIVHIRLDALEAWVDVTIPAAIGEEDIIRVIERFAHVCRNSTTPWRHEPHNERITNLHKQAARLNAPMKALAEQWPHYVLPPDNPLAFLDSDTPCSFFGV